MVLTAAQRRAWQQGGFLVIPGFFEPAEVERVERSLRSAWEQCRPDVTVDDLVTGRRARMSDLSAEERAHQFKVNDLYLIDPEVRGICLSRRVGDIVTELLGDQPVLCNTLNLAKGSQQADHIDTLYMTPRTEERLVATWMALEDVADDAGPLRYYPQSHVIAPYRFENGGMHVVDAEMPRWAEYIATEVDGRGLAETRFLARRGDLFIWHAQLLHGGSEICDLGLTRNSLVSHFWGRADCEALGHDMAPAEGGMWFRRPPQPVPGIPAPAAAVAADPPPARPAPRRPLFERLLQLLR